MRPPWLIRRDRLRISSNRKPQASVDRLLETKDRAIEIKVAHLVVKEVALFARPSRSSSGSMPRQRALRFSAHRPASTKHRRDNERRCLAGSCEASDLPEGNDQRRNRSLRRVRDLCARVIEPSKRRRSASSVRSAHFACRVIGSAQLDHTVFRHQTEAYQPRRDGADSALMRRCNCCDRITRQERGT
jgi:hypothetical protein